MKSNDPREQEILSLAQQLRDCRELLNQTNQELAALGNVASELASALKNHQLAGAGHIIDHKKYANAQKEARQALTNYRSAKQ